MNIHIELVKKWLADPTSVTQQELEDNRDAADCAYHADFYEAVSSAAAYYTYYAADAANAAADARSADAEYWVERYEELTK